MRVLIVEPPNTGRLVSIWMRMAGHTHEVVELAEEAIEMVSLYDYDIVVSDSDLPDMPGVSMLRVMRRAGRSVPVLFVSHQTGVATRVDALNAGADGWIVRPCSREELCATICSIVRRARGGSHPVVRIGGLEVDLAEQVVSVGGQRVHLTGTQYKMLEILILRKNQTVSKGLLLESLYHGRDEPGPKILDVYICKLRKILGSEGRMIQTVWGRGFRLQELHADAA